MVCDMGHYSTTRLGGSYRLSCVCISNPDCVCIRDQLMRNALCVCTRHVVVNLRRLPAVSLGNLHTCTHLSFVI